MVPPDRHYQAFILERCSDCPILRNNEIELPTYLDLYIKVPTIPTYSYTKRHGALCCCTMYR